MNPAVEELFIEPDGSIVGLYSDGLDLRGLAAALGGELEIARASRVEPTPDARWCADMGPVAGPVLGPFDSRGEALAEERQWIRENVLGVRA